MPVELYPHQQKAVDDLSNGKILLGDVGGGKTFTALFYYFTKECKGVVGDWTSMRQPKDLYVITTAKKRNSFDWQMDALKLGLGEDREHTLGNVKVTVDSWNNISKYIGVQDAFFIFDEQRVVGSGTWTKAFYKITKQNNWILLSATPGDTWMDYIPVFVANGFYKNKTDFVRQHVVYSAYSKFPKVERYVGVGRLLRLRNQILVEMPFERHTTREIHEVKVDHDVELLEKVVKKRWHVYEERPLRDVAELFLVMRKVVNSDPSRLRALEVMMEKHPKLIVFYNFDYELEMLRTLGTPKSLLTMSDDVESGLNGRKTMTSGSSETPSSEQSASIHNPTPSGTDLSSLFRQNPSVQQLLSKSLPLEPKSSFEERLITGDHFSCEIADRNHQKIECLTGSVSSSTASKTSSSLPGSSGTSSTHSATVSSDLSCSEQDRPSFAVAEWNGHKHQPVPTTDRWVYLVQYQAGAEGWNCTETDAMVFYSMTYSYKLWHQAFGRIDRLNTPFSKLHYYILMSNSLIDKAVRRSLRAKKSFNEKRLAPKL